jgi:hypothetical protein
MRNPKELALEAVVETLKQSGIAVTKNLESLIDDLLDEQWESRNREILPGKDEAALFKLVKDFVAQHGSGVEN